jgi:hypothetical protein
MFSFSHSAGLKTNAPAGYEVLRSDVFIRLNFHFNLVNCFLNAGGFGTMAG